MPGEWISGKEIMEEYGKLAVEIGKAVYDGELYAFTEALVPILEETRVAKIPKYPPVGVNCLDHVKYEPNPIWDWTEELTGNPDDFRYETERIRNLRMKGYIPENLNVEKINANAIQLNHDIKHGRYGKDKINSVDIVELSAINSMKTGFDYFFSDYMGSARSFCFLFDTFVHFLNSDPFYRLSILSQDKDKHFQSVSLGNSLSDRHEIYPIYKGFISQMVFPRIEVKAWIDNAVESSEPPVSHKIDSPIKDYVRLEHPIPILDMMAHFIFPFSLGTSDGAMCLWNFFAQHSGETIYSPIYRLVEKRGDILYYKKQLDLHGDADFLFLDGNALAEFWDICPREFLKDTSKNPFRATSTATVFPPIGAQLSTPASSPQADTVNKLPQGGSRPETEKIHKTKEACNLVETTIVDDHNHLDRRGRIGINEFVEAVKQCLEAHGNGPFFQKTAAQRYFKASSRLEQFKRQRGQKQ